MMFYMSTKASTEVDWSGHTLFLPAISVGNVGQLSIDLLIATLRAQKVGVIYDESLIPVAGNNPYHQSEGGCQLSTCCEVYHAEKEKCVIIQQRAPFVRGKRRMFREKLIKWIKEKGFLQTILISSIFAHTRTDQQMTSNQFRYLATDDLKTKVANLNEWVELEDTEDAFSVSGKHCPGSGIAKTFYSDCIANKIPALVTFMFCSEGDNTLDALRMVNCINRYIGVRPRKTRETLHELKEVWIEPVSWQLNFGNRYVQTIY